MDKEKKIIEITVNGNAVSLGQHKVTGLQIKEAAISQGVSIQLDFNLFEVKGKLILVSDSEDITIHTGQVFRALTTDDNSQK